MSVLPRRVKPGDVSPRGDDETALAARGHRLDFDPPLDSMESPTMANALLSERKAKVAVPRGNARVTRASVPLVSSPSHISKGEGAPAFASSPNSAG